MHVILILTICITLSACANLVSYEVEPNLRQQLYTRQEGSIDAVGSGNLCGVDHSGLGPVVIPELERDDILLGYKSFESPVDARPRCRRDVNIEHHAWVSFDVSAFTASLGVPRQGRDAQLTSYIITGTPVNEANNENCNESSLLSSIRLFGGWVLTRTLDNLSEVPISPGDFRLDEDTFTLREAANLEYFPVKYTRFDSEGRIVFVFDAAEIEFNSSAIPAFAFTFIGAENTTWTDDHECLMQFKDIRLSLVFRE